ncbi:MAG: biopolymer transporter ExbD [Chitinophagales bacterium]|nr:biopolymer transporter ExbD [Chitinophagales bacterium]
MPKVKVPRKSTPIDMTAMCDVAFLLLTFFMLTTKFKPDEKIKVNIPASVAETKLPDKDILMLHVDQQGKVFYGIDNQGVRQQLLEFIKEEHPELQFNGTQTRNFMLMDSWGVPLAELPALLNDPKNYPQKGINLDTLAIPTTAGELGQLLMLGRRSNPAVRIAIKADADADYRIVKDVIAILQKRNINKFNLITATRQKPKE